MSRVEDAIIAAEACVIISKHKRTLRRYWVRPSLQARSMYGVLNMYAEFH